MAAKEPRDSRGRDPGQLRCYSGWQHRAYIENGRRSDRPGEQAGGVRSEKWPCLSMMYEHFTDSGR